MARLPNGMDNVRTTNASEEAPFRAEEEHEAIEVLEDGKKLDGVLHEREEPATLGISLNPRTVSGANLDSPALMMVSGEGVEEDEEEERIEMRPYDPPDLRELGVFAGEGLERAKGMPTLKARGTSTVSHTETSNPAIIDLPQSVHGPPLRVQTSNPSTDPLDIIPLSDDHDTPILLDSLPSAAQPTSFQSAAADPPRTRRRIAIVEIPLMPLHRIRQYGSSSRSGQPTLRSRGQNRIQPISVASSSRESSVFSARPIRAAARRGQASRVQSSVRSSRDSEDFGSYDTVDDDDDDDDDEDGDVSEASESDAVVLRRSGRTGKKRSPEVRRSTRVAKRSPSTRVSTISSVSETSFYGAKRKAKVPQRSSLRLQPAQRRRMEDDDESGSAYEAKSEEDDRDNEYVDGSSGSDTGRRKKPNGPALKAHRSYCEKCSRGPAGEMLGNALARKSKPGMRRKRDDDEMSDEELARELEGWVECEKCVVASHWGCLASTQKKEVLYAILDQEGPPPEGQRRRVAIRIDEKATFVCARCTTNPTCFVCHEERVVMAKKEEQIGLGLTRSELPGDDEPMQVDQVEPNEKHASPGALLFRCRRCKQAAHYEHLKQPDGQRLSKPDLAEHYQYQTDTRGDAWSCHQCREWIWTVEIICAWRPSPASAKEAKREEGEKPYYKDQLPREYLVKWTGRGFRHATWVPHAWLLAMSSAKLRNFLEKGPSLDLVTDETLAAKGDDISEPTIARVMEEDDRVHGQKSSTHHSTAGEWEGHGPAPDVNAEAAIPNAWRTIDRVLDVMLFLPRADKPKKKKGAIPRRNTRILSESASSQASEPVEIATIDMPSMPDGVEPPTSQRIDIDEWQRRAGRTLMEEDAEEVARLVTWCFVKWDDLQYDQSCWDTPPPTTSHLYADFKRAITRYLRARQVVVPVLSSSKCRERDAKAASAYVPPKEQPECIVGGMEGFQWLLYKHFKRESCILADDMGLGKTIQIAAVLGYLGTDKHQVYPSLVIVPNSTITNWVREFEKWVPRMRVVPYYGEAASRKIISKYELYHKGMQGKANGLKAHVVLTTYDMITGAEFRVFAGVPRWEVLCVDEGQRLKSDGSLIFNRLKTLNSVHRILLTGTPLNNNLRELFNLLNFLDPVTFKYLEDLEKRFEKLNEGLVQELHEMIKPYILRRIKADVLKLPPKVEIIVPISLTPLQKHVYKGILERNADILKAIAASRRKRIAKNGELPQTAKPAGVP